jgi:hypothetical protein
MLPKTNPQMLVPIALRRMQSIVCITPRGGQVSPRSRGTQPGARHGSGPPCWPTNPNEASDWCAVKTGGTSSGCQRRLWSRESLVGPKQSLHQPSASDLAALRRHSRNHSDVREPNELRLVATLYSIYHALWLVKGLVCVCFCSVNLSPINCSVKMSPHERESDIDTGRTEEAGCSR